jgi:hypothetical protein
MHDTYYNPESGVLWRVKTFVGTRKIDAAMARKRLMLSGSTKVLQLHEVFGRRKTIHIGETGWATVSNEMYVIPVQRRLTSINRLNIINS